MSNHGIAEKYEEVAVQAVNLVEGIRRTGVRVLELWDRHAKLCMPLESNGNHVGIMYAGSLFAIAELMGGVIPAVSMDMSEVVPIVKEASIRYVAPAMSDVFLTTEFSEEEVDTILKNVAEKGKADFRLEMEVKDVNDKVVAIVNGIWQVRSITKGFGGA